MSAMLKRKAGDRHDGKHESRPAKVNKRQKPEILIRSINSLQYTDFIQTHVPSHAFSYTPKAHDITPTHDGQRTTNALFDITLKLSPSNSARSAQPEQIISDTDLDTCYRMIEETSGDAYRASSTGWHPRRKKREMRESDMRYLLARRRDLCSESVTGRGDEDGALSPTYADPDAQSHAVDSDTNSIGVPIASDTRSRPLDGFASFMLTLEDGRAVIYLYEIHLSLDTRGCGLGAHLLSVVETVGTSAGVDKIMLTVFRANEEARAWYQRRGYEVDEFSPPEKMLRGGAVKQVDYLILSKTLHPDR